MLNVIIIDPRPILRFGMKYYLENSFSEIQIEDFRDVDESKFSSLTNPHIIFLGIEQFVTDFKLISEIKKYYRKSKVIVYDPDGQSKSAVKYLRAGAKGYLSKQFNYELIQTCCEKVLAGKFYVDPNDLDVLLDQLIPEDASPSPVPTFARNLALTPRQIEIAMLMAKGMGTCRIAEQLGLQASTISTVKSTIYSKLRIDSVIDLNKLIYSHSYQEQT
jgi:two-component system invasion response regulator UvrY